MASIAFSHSGSSKIAPFLANAEHYNYFRDYDPSIGRYVQSDPVGLLGGLNTYGYVDANPLAIYDPRGLQSCPIPPDPCPPLIAHIERHLAGMERKYADMLRDQYGLYAIAYNARLPGELAGLGTWVGHQAKYEGERIGLMRLIKQAESLGCAVPPNAYVVAARPAPTYPNLKNPK